MSVEEPAKPFTIRISAALRARIEKVIDRKRDPYAPTKTQIGLRGLELALKEREKAK